MALTDVAVSIRCVCLLICNQSDKGMCVDTLSLTVDQINKLSLSLRQSVPFLCLSSLLENTTLDHHFLSVKKFKIIFLCCGWCQSDVFGLVLFDLRI